MQAAGFMTLPAQPLARRQLLLYRPALRIDRLIKGCRGDPESSFPSLQRRPSGFSDPERQVSRNDEESQMPKMKTKSGAKKRFKITATGKVMYAQSGKRHGMIKRSNKQIREHRGTTALFETDAYNVKRYFLPNG